MPPIDYPAIDWLAVSPMIVVLVGALVLLVVGSLTRMWPRSLYALVTVAVVVPAVILEMVLWNRVGHEGPVSIVDDALSIDRLTLFAWIGITVAVGLVALSTSEYLRREELDGPETYAMYLAAAIGAMVMASANDFVVMFLGLETLSIALYVLAASHRRRAESQESGLKYFVLGGFASAFFLYGIALLYGSTGTTNLSGMGEFLRGQVFLDGDDAMLLAGLALLLVGLGFKIAAVPFHFWTPDVYQGAPTPTTSFMASIGKFAAFAAMLRVLLVALPTRADDWRPVVWVMAIASVVIGSILAVAQTDVKRMLAYSSISHAGFILIGVEAAGHSGDTAGLPSALLYLMLYSVLVVGTFTVISLVSRTGDGRTDLASFRGLSKERPALALAMTVFLFAQAGMPVTSGFIAKFGVIKAAADNQSYAVAIVAMVASVIAAVLYLRIMISMWLSDAETGDETREKVAVPFTSAIVILAAVIFTIVAGVFPGWLIDASRDALAVVR
ncbi:MAG: NADH-quinone oxidoreductase subunit [Actinomycetota bacterium]|jgi:NADH-quinone oxidoreductase subunit N